MNADQFSFAGMDRTGTVNDNTLTIASGASTQEAFGGWALGPVTTATRNTLIVEGTVLAAVGGSSDNGDATGNTVLVKKGGVVTNMLVGGATTTSGNATDNFVTLAGGTVMGDVAGGRCTALPGSTCDGLKDNILTVTDTDSSIGGEVKNFEKLVFTLPATIAHGQTMLTLGGNVDFSTIKSASLTVDGAPALNERDTITLIQFAGSGTVSPPTSITLPMTVTCGGWEFEVKEDGNKVIAEVKAAPAPTPGPAPDPAPTPGAGGGDSSSPTMGELGLLLSGIALAGAAAPALRRRERKARKQD